MEYLIAATMGDFDLIRFETGGQIEALQGMATQEMFHGNGFAGPE